MKRNKKNKKNNKKKINNQNINIKKQNKDLNEEKDKKQNKQKNIEENNDTQKVEELPKYKKEIFELMKEGYKFAIELDNSLKDASEIDKLGMFSYIIVPKKIRLYKEIMRRNKKSQRIIFE